LAAEENIIFLERKLWREDFWIEYQKYYELFVANYKEEYDIDYDE